MLAQAPKSSAVAEIERLGFKWHEESQYDLSKLSPDRRIQVRESEHYAPKNIVAQYAVQMKETVFPSIVVTANDWLGDGNTRVGAYEVNKIKFAPAIVLDVEYGKNPKTDADLHALAATLNQQGGQRLTPAEARSVAVTLVERGWKNDAIGRATGIKSGVVNNIRREIAARDKFAKVGFKDASKLGPSALRTFGMEPQISLNDVPFAKLVGLSVDANLGPAEIRELAVEMKKTGSDAGMITFIDGKRGEMSERIREHALMGNGKPPASSQLRRHLGYINGHGLNPNALVERAPAAMSEHLLVVQNAIKVLNNVAVAQEKLINE